MAMDIMLSVKQRKAAAILARRFINARSDFGSFVELIARDDHGVPLRLALMHRQWVAHINFCWERKLKPVILAHFGSGKSSTLAVPLIAHLLGNDTNTRVKIITNDDGSASKRVQAIKRMIDSSMYSKVFPEVRKGDKWTDHELYLRREGQAIDPSVHARGVFTTGIGGRADVLVFDDVVDQKNSMDSIQRRKTLDVIEQTWLSRLEPDGRTLYIGTVWHSNDATHNLMQRTGWCSLIQRVSDDCQHIEQEVVGNIYNTAAYPVVK